MLQGAPLFRGVKHDKQRVAEQRALQAKRRNEARAFEARDVEEQRVRAEESRQARDVIETAKLTAELRVGYFASPGATDENFNAALPTLLEERRQTAASTALDQSRRAIGASVRRLI